MDHSSENALKTGTMFDKTNAHEAQFTVTCIRMVIGEYGMSLEMGLPGQGLIQTELRDSHESILKKKT